MTQKLINFLGLGMLFTFLLISCRTEERFSLEQNAAIEKIGFFERFETQSTSSQRKGVAPNYALPFAQSINAYFLKNPEVGNYFREKYGSLDERVSSQSIDGDNGEKLLFFPVRDINGKVVAILSGVVSGNRDYLYYDVWKDENPDVLYLISRFQEYYNERSVSKEGEGVIQEVVITVLRPIAKSSFDGWLGVGGSGNGGSDGGHLASGGAGNYNSGGPVITVSTQSNPCEKAENANEKANEITSDTEFTDRKDIAKEGVANGKFEKGFIFGKHTDGSLKFGDVKTGTEMGINLDATNPGFTVIGSVHTHPGPDSFDSFSPRDFLAMLTNVNVNSNFELMFVLGATGNEYCMTVTDINKLKSFFSNNTNTIGEDNGWVKSKPIGTYFTDVLTQFYHQGKSLDEAYALANVAVLTKFDLGIAMSKKDPTIGKFKTIFVKETKDTIDPDKIQFEETTTCNL